MCQVEVGLGYANWKLEPWPLWAMVDAEIFLPEAWFGDEYAELLCGRYFVERVIQDSKDKVGADEFQAQKHLAWEHHPALTACALWFIATTRLDWAKDSPVTQNWFNNLNLKLCLPSLDS